MKDAIYYENRFFERLQELFSLHAQKQIMRNERAEIYHFFMYEKYKLFIRKSRKDFNVCGQYFEDLNKLEMFEDVEILQSKKFYNVYFKGEYNECVEYYGKLIKRGIENGLFAQIRVGNKRQKRKTNKS